MIYYAIIDSVTTRYFLDLIWFGFLVPYSFSWSYCFVYLFHIHFSWSYCLVYLFHKLFPGLIVWFTCSLYIFMVLLFGLLVPYIFSWSYCFVYLFHIHFSWSDCLIYLFHKLFPGLIVSFTCSINIFLVILFGLLVL